MLSPEYLANCTDILLGLYDELDRAIIADIARRIVKTGGVSETARIQAERAQQSGALLEDVTRMVAEISGFTDEEITRMFEEAGIRGMENDARPLMLNGQSVSLRLSPAMRQTLEAAIAKTKGDMRNLTLTTGVTAMEKYREAVNAAYMMTQSGAFPYQTAIREAVRQAAADGNWVSFASGHRDRLDVAVRRSVLTGLNQTAGKLTELYSADMGAEYYEVSAHAGARPSHTRWQGKVYKIVGSAPGYPNFAESTGYGTGAGLCGWNCRHSFYPFWPGISTRAYTPELLRRYDAPRYEYEGQKLTEYEVSQMMRKSERDIRAIKRELAGYRAAMEAAQDPVLQGDLQEAFDETSVGLKATESRYKDLCQKTRHEPDSVRTAVVAILDKDGHIIAYDRSLAQKARRAKERVENTANKLYNKGSTEENVKLLLADNEQRRINRSDAIPKTILPGAQKKHIRGTNEYKTAGGNRSYLTISLEEAQELVNQYAGTGDIKRSNKDGSYNNHEVCTADRIIGVIVDPLTGQEIGSTHKFTIHYAPSKGGVHIVPAKE